MLLYSSVATHETLEWGHPQCCNMFIENFEVWFCKEFSLKGPLDIYLLCLKSKKLLIYSLSWQLDQLRTPLRGRCKINIHVEKCKHWQTLLIRNLRFCRFNYCISSSAGISWELGGSEEFKTRFSSKRDSCLIFQSVWMEKSRWKTCLLPDLYQMRFPSKTRVNTVQGTNRKSSGKNKK